MAHKNKHMDCHNYAALDVAKGFCHARKQLVMADDDACELFEKAPRCKYCAKYTPSKKEHLGTCGASPDRPMTYPDLSGVTCEWFSWKER